MPIGGETVGRAYVRILADGSQVPDGIRDSLNNPDADKAFKQAGERSSDLYQEGFNKELADPQRRKEMQRLLAESISVSSGDMDARAQNIADGLFDGLKGSLRHRVGDNVIADQIWQNILGDYKSGTPIEDLARRLRERLPVEIEEATEQIVSIEDAYRRDREAAYKENNRRLVEDFTTTYHKMAQGVSQLERGEKNALVTHRESVFEVQRLREVLAKLPGSERDKLSGDLDLLTERVQRATPLTSRFSRVVDDLSDHLGRATGRGSRNNFLNFIGSANRGLTRLILLGPRIALSVGEKMVTAFFEGGKGLSGLVSAGQALGPMALSVAAGVAGIAVAVSLLLIGMGPLVALFSGLLGILTALSSTVIFALIGGLVGIAGALVPLIAGIGIAVAGFVSMDDALKDKLSKTIEPVKDQLKDLGRVLRDELFRDAPEQAELMGNILDDLTPVTRRLAAAVRDVATAWLEAADSQGFRDFIDRMEIFLPKAIGRLGKIIENTASALGGMFEASLPFINRFLRNLVEVTDQWAEWANSASGQQDIADFLDKAADSASSLGGFLESVLGLVSELLDQGNSTGNTIFDDMANAVDKFTQKLEDNPEMLDDWYESAKKLADEIGDLFVDIGELFDELDNEENRQAIRDIVDLFGDLADALSDIEETIGPVLGPLLTLLGYLSDLYELSKKDIVFGISFSELLNPAALLDDMQSKIGTVLFDLGVNPESIDATIGHIRSIFSNLPQLIRQAIGEIPWERMLTQGIPGIPSRIVAYFLGLPERIIGAATPINWERIQEGLRAVVNGLPGFFAGVALGIIERIIPINWDRLGDGLRAFVDSIPGFFIGLAPRIVSAIGRVVVDVIPNLLGLGDGPSVSGPGGASWGEDAAGGIYTSPRLSWTAEAGPEAIVPLARPLGQVDPSVRWLSAIAQGLSGSFEGMAAGGVRGGKTIDASGWTIVSPQSDARAVATEALNYLVATAYTA